jgi:hypothetical protein
VKTPGGQCREWNTTPDFGVVNEKPQTVLFGNSFMCERCTNLAIDAGPAMLAPIPSARPGMP